VRQIITGADTFLLFHSHEVFQCVILVLGRRAPTSDAILSLISGSMNHRERLPHALSDDHMPEILD